jgi:hypothetical protein
MALSRVYSQNVLYVLWNCLQKQRRILRIFPIRRSNRSVQMNTLTFFAGTGWRCSGQDGERFIFIRVVDFGRRTQPSRSSSWSSPCGTGSRAQCSTTFEWAWKTQVVFTGESQEWSADLVEWYLITVVDVRCEHSHRLWHLSLRDYNFSIKRHLNPRNDKTIDGVQRPCSIK